MSYSIPLTLKHLDLLIANHLDLNFDYLLKQAVYNNDLPMCNRLIDLGANPKDESLLFSCVSNKYSTPTHLEIIELLLSYHENINKLNRPLLSDVNNIEIFKLLLKSGADWKLKNSNGSTMKDILKSKVQNEHTATLEQIFQCGEESLTEENGKYKSMLQILEEYETHSLTKPAHK